MSTTSSHVEGALPVQLPQGSSIDIVDESRTNADDDTILDDRNMHISSVRWEERRYYDWKKFFPRDGGICSFLRWLRSGFGGERAHEETGEDMRKNLHMLATLLLLLRGYYATFGMPEQGGPKDQEFVLREVMKDLYAGGAPIWSLEPAMERGAEGLTGKTGVDFCVFPRKAFIFAPSSGATSMFRISSGFNIQRLTEAERILVRIASFASNTHGVSSLPSRLPDPAVLYEAVRKAELTASASSTRNEVAQAEPDREAMAAKILHLASHAEGLFFFINSTDRPDASFKGEDASNNNTIHYSNGERAAARQQFWKVEEHISELFSRLAAIEAIRTMDEIDANKRVLYSKPVLTLFRFVASAGACAFWFQGGWIDMAVAGCCGSLVGLISTWSVLSREERLVFESFASLLVGLIAGVVNYSLPTKTCFGAIGVAGVLDILQGFRVVYAVIELMGKHSVCGSADFLEGLLYTGLIAYFLKFGQLIAEHLIGTPTTDAALTCSNSIDQRWYLLLVPAAALSWSGLFNPDYEDLPWMAFHGVLAYTITWASSLANIQADFSLFLAAMSVTFSAGLVSRFTGRQAMGNTVAGLYTLVPGAYLVNSLFADLSFNFMGPVIFNAAIIGTGAWAGTILCSPTILGTTATLLKKHTGVGQASHREHSIRQNGMGAMLFF